MSKETFLEGLKPALRQWHHLIKDRDTTEEEFVNDLIHRFDLVIAQTREETIREVENGLPIPDCIEEEYYHQEVINLLSSLREGNK